MHPLKVLHLPIDEIPLSELDDVQLTQLAMTLEAPSAVLEAFLREVKQGICPCRGYESCIFYKYANHMASTIEWPDDGVALELLKHNFEVVDCTITPRVAEYTPHAIEQSAIDYLCDQWSHSYEAEPRDSESEEYLQ